MIYFIRIDVLPIVLVWDIWRVPVEGNDYWFSPHSAHCRYSSSVSPPSSKQHPKNYHQTHQTINKQSFPKQTSNNRSGLSHHLHSHSHSHRKHNNVMFEMLASKNLRPATKYQSISINFNKFKKHFSIRLVPSPPPPAALHPTEII